MTSFCKMGRHSEFGGNPGQENERHSKKILQMLEQSTVEEIYGGFEIAERGRGS